MIYYYHQKISRAGRVRSAYSFGGITAQIFNNDCIVGMKAIPDESVDMILTDPPYGITNCKWDKILPLPPWWEQISRVIKPNGAVLMFSNQPFTTVLISSSTLKYRYPWYWMKNNVTNFINVKRMPLRKIEEIHVFSKRQCLYYPQGLVENQKAKIKTTVKSSGVYREVNSSGKPYMAHQFMNYPVNILCFDNESNRFHPTQKPIQLLEYLIRTYTLESETVLDCCMGSGSTGVACAYTKRGFIGFETDEKYFNIAQNRIETAEEHIGKQ